VFQTRGPATVNDRSPTVERLTDDTSKLLVGLFFAQGSGHRTEACGTPHIRPESVDRLVINLFVTSTAYMLPPATERYVDAKRL